MTQRQIRATVYDMQGRMVTCSLFQPSTEDHANPNVSLDDLINEGVLGETGFHLVEKPRDIKKFQNYEARRQQQWNEYHKRVLRD